MRSDNRDGYYKGEIGILDRLKHHMSYINLLRFGDLMRRIGGQAYGATNVDHTVPVRNRFFNFDIQLRTRKSRKGCT